MVATQADHPRVANGVVQENRHITGPSAHIDEGHAQVLFVMIQHRFRGSQRFQHYILNMEAGAFAALDDILDGRNGPRYNVDLGFKPDPGHADRVVDPFLVIDDELLRKHVQNLPVKGQSDGAGGIHNAIHIGLGDLPALDGDNAVTVEALDVGSRNPCEDRGNLAAGHQFRFIDGLADRMNGLVDIDHHASAQANRRVGPHADDIDPFRGHFPHYRADFRGPEVKADDQFLSFSHRSPFTVSSWMAFTPGLRGAVVRGSNSPGLMIVSASLWCVCFISSGVGATATLRCFRQSFSFRLQCHSGSAFRDTTHC